MTNSYFYHAKVHKRIVSGVTIKNNRVNNRIPCARPDYEKSAKTFWKPSWNTAVQRVFCKMNGVAVSLASRLRAVFLGLS